MNRHQTNKIKKNISGLTQSYVDANDILKYEISFFCEDGVDSESNLEKQSFINQKKNRNQLL